MAKAQKYGEALMSTKRHVDPVTAAEETLLAIGEKKLAAQARQNDMLEQMGDLGYAAHGLGDTVAQKRIRELSAACQLVDHEMLALNAAQVEAGRRLAAARRDAERDVIRGKANEALAKIPQLRAAGIACADGLAKFIENYSLLHTLSNDLRRAGVGRAWRDEVFTLACRRSLQFALYGASLNTEAISAPSSRRELGEVLEKFVSEFAASIEQQLAELEPAEYEEAAQ
jgi:hypothetical protein